MSSHSLPAAASRCPVVDGAAFDPLGAQESRDPMPWLRAAQHYAPVFFMPRYDMWCVTRYEDVIAVLRDPVTYSSRKTINLEKLPPDLLSAFPDGPPDRVLVSLDPPDLTRLRGLARNAFTPRWNRASAPAVTRSSTPSSPTGAVSSSRSTPASSPSAP